MLKRNIDIRGICSGFVEAFFYIWVILALKDLKIMTSRRYIDWFITTPTMLVSTIVFLNI